MLDGKRNNQPITIRSDEPLRKAAEMMMAASIGSLVVVDDDGKIVGMLTDRDLCLRAVAFDRDPDTTTVAGCMTADVRTLEHGADMTDQIYRMRSIGTRRLPLVDETGSAREIAAIDDMLLWASARLTELAWTARHAELREPGQLLRELEAHLEAREGEPGAAALGERLEVPIDSLHESIKKLRAGLVAGREPGAV